MVVGSVVLAWTALAWTASLRPRACAVPLVMSAPNKKQMSSSELITYAGLTDEWQALTSVALKRLDKNRVMQGKPKYESIAGMTDAYVEEAASANLGWTRADAESEVVRYLMRQALADEGGIGGDGGDGQDKMAFGMLTVLLGLGVLSGASSLGVLDAFK